MTPAPEGDLGWRESCRARLFEDTKDILPAMRPREYALGVREGLEHVLNGLPDRRNRAGLTQPRAATLREGTAA